MMIFDRFPTMGEALDFADFVREAIGYDAKAYTERRDDIDPFPFELTGPVVYTARGTVKKEEAMTEAVRRFGGRFAGT